MTAERFKNRINAGPTLIRAAFYFRLFMVIAVIGLAIAFLMGRILPDKWAESLSKMLGFSRPGDGQPDEMLVMLGRFFHNNKRLSALFPGYRYLVIGVLLNMPGIYIVGGGGGISLACGSSRSVSFKLFLLTVVLAVSPVPLLSFLGAIQLESLF